MTADERAAAPDEAERAAVTLATDGYATSVSIFGRHLATFTIRGRAEQLARDLRERLHAYVEARVAEERVLRDEPAP